MVRDGDACPYGFGEHLDQGRFKRKQLLELRSQGLPLREPGDLLGSGIAQGNPTVAPHYDNAVPHTVDHGGVVVITFFLLLFTLHRCLKHVPDCRGRFESFPSEIECPEKSVRNWLSGGSRKLRQILWHTSRYVS